MRRRVFMGLLVGAAACPVAARPQQPERVRRIGFLTTLSADDSESKGHVAAFQRGLQPFGWADGRNLRIDYRWVGGDAGCRG